MRGWKRLLLKLSGEALGGTQQFGIDPQALAELSHALGQVQREGIQLAVVVGGGNVVRGVQAQASGMSRVLADEIGMLATVMNALALADALKQRQIPCAVLSAIAVEPFAARYSRQQALELMERGVVLLLAGGTSQPFFSTDTAAVLRALELEAQVVAKATNVDGVYDKDPKKHPDARLYRKLTFQEVLEKGLGFMDATAAALCREHGLPVVVFNLRPVENIIRMAKGEEIGTLVHA